MVDANMKWSADLAIRAARAFAPFDLTWLEEPISPDDVAGHARVVRDGGLPIAAGENLRTLVGFPPPDRQRRRHLPRADVTNCGGVTAFMKIAHLAEAFNLPVTSHGAHDVTCTCWPPARTAPSSRRMASGWSATSPSRSGWKTAWLSRPNGRATGSSSIGRAWRRSGRSC
jgi:hypothetical protein